MKKLGYTALGILLIGLIWYLFIKPYDYTIRFKANTFPGAINQMLKQWDPKTGTIAKIEQNGSIYQLTQQMAFNDSIHRYEWNIQPLTDSTSRVQVNVTDINHSFSNKIKVPFSDTDFEKRSRKTAREFIKALNEHITKFKVSVSGIDELEATFCAYVSVTTKQTEKAIGMMANYPNLTGFLKDNDIKENGIPFVEVTNWDKMTDTVTYDFCFPIVYHDSLPKNNTIKYKKRQPIKGLKAIYNGNYITSDRAWYALMDYAKKNNIEVEAKPIEVFYNNPNQGGDELSWKAEIFLPLKEQGIE